MADIAVFQAVEVEFSAEIFFGVFTFLYDYQIPPDNNASERAIRNIKVQQKVFGQFKTKFGAEIYVLIRSIIYTCIKNNQNILSAFYTIVKLVPE